MAYSLAQLNDAVRTDPQGFVQECDAAYNKKIDSAARKIADNLKKSRIVLLSGPSGSGKTTTAKKIEARLEQLETLLDAGLLDREEYRERKRRIEEEMG